MAETTPDPIMKIAMGFMASKHLFVANEIGLFEGLAKGPATIVELSKMSEIPPRTLAIVANAMVALGLVERNGDRYTQQRCCGYLPRWPPRARSAGKFPILESDQLSDMAKIGGSRSQRRWPSPIRRLQQGRATDIF